MQHILLDTNILMAVSQFKIDIFSELSRISDFQYDVSILDLTLNELKSIQLTQRGEHKLAATIALDLIQKNAIGIVKTNSKGSVDNVIAHFSKQGYIVATQDMLLKKRLKKPYITIRKKEYLIIVN